MRKFTKALLLELAEEFDTNVSQANKVREIRQAILNAEDYEEEAAKEYAARIWAAAEQKKAEEIAEKERAESEQERAEQEREQERAEREREQERAERERERVKTDECS